MQNSPAQIGKSGHPSWVPLFFSIFVNHVVLNSRATLHLDANDTIVHYSDTPVEPQACVEYRQNNGYVVFQQKAARLCILSVDSNSWEFSKLYILGIQNKCKYFFQISHWPTAEENETWFFL